MHHQRTCAIKNQSYFYTYPVSYNYELIKLIGKKKELHAINKAPYSYLLYPEFKDLRSRCKRLSTLLYNNYVLQTENNLLNNPKQF